MRQLAISIELLVFGLLIYAPCCGFAAEPLGQVGPSNNSKPNDAAKRPTILLTGFEPFGEVRTANPSWEGVRLLDGKEFHEYRLVSKQMRVVWGEPIKQLQEWIDEEHPVAIFSFGQGARGHFAIESLASNNRGTLRDNHFQFPSASKIAVTGPDSYAASIDSKILLESLKKKGYPARISRQAGRYLCEECLYSLEQLRAEKKVLHVMFCHVPPFDSTVAEKPVTAELIRDFVQDTLEAWHDYQSKSAK